MGFGRDERKKASLDFLEAVGQVLGVSVHVVFARVACYRSSKVELAALAALPGGGGVRHGMAV